MFEVGDFVVIRIYRDLSWNTKPDTIPGRFFGNFLDMCVVRVGTLNDHRYQEVPRYWVARDLEARKDFASLPEKHQRLDKANLILELIARHGRHFFAHDGLVSQFTLRPDGKLFFVDSYTQKAIYTASSMGKWRGFTEGGNNLDLVKNLADYIRTGAPIHNHFGPWPDWVCGGDLWGYGESMIALRSNLASLIPEVVKQ
jgi:hypothetical protein